MENATSDRFGHSHAVTPEKRFPFILLMTLRGCWNKGRRYQTGLNLDNSVLEPMNLNLASWRAQGIALPWVYELLIEKCNCFSARRHQ
jgi:hypothetical protein